MDLYLGTPVTSGLGYAVTVQQQPSPWICVVVRGAGAVLGANITDIQVNCADSVVEDTGNTIVAAQPSQRHCLTTGRS
jgi:hypothetical protein